jgi:all-trans-8'-apo-beta-carotenal 15,15'-oxygenase
MVAATRARAPAPASAPTTTDAPAALPLAARLWSLDLPREHGFEPLAIEGTIPSDLRGTLFRNGPGLFGQFGKRYAHPFEGDGAITAVRIDDTGAYGASRVHASTGLAEERAAGKLLYGLSAPWLRRVGNTLRDRYKNTANTSVVMWQGRLFALMEAGKPTEVDPRDLSTIGETDLDGTVVSMFSAHPHRVASRRAIYNFGLEYGRKTRLHVYELPDVGAARHLGAIELAGPPMLHDFIATDTHLVFFVSPVRVDVPRMLLQIGSFTDLFKWKPHHGVEVICVPIDRPAEPVRFTVDAFYQWHFTNAFSRGRELVVDYVRYPDFSSFAEIGGFASGTSYTALGEGRPHRAVIDLSARTLRSDEVVDRDAEFPTVAPGREGRDHRYTYLALGSLGGIGRLDATTAELVAHELPETQRATEPLFVPRPGAATESDGYLVSLCHDDPADRAFLAIYDAARIPDGPVARAWFDHQVPITFHGTWANGLT